MPAGSTIHQHLLLNRGSKCFICTSKKIIQPSSAFPPLYRDFCKLIIETSIYHWVPRMLFAHLIYLTHCLFTTFHKQLLITAFNNIFTTALTYSLEKLLLQFIKWKYHICLTESTFDSSKLIKKLSKDKFPYLKVQTTSKGFSSRKDNEGNLI